MEIVLDIFDVDNGRDGDSFSRYENMIFMFRGLLF